MEGLRDAGAERIGLSLYKTEELKYLIDNEVEFDIIQAPFNILDQRFKDYFKILEDMHAEVYARSIFLQGLFFEKRDKIKKNFGNAWDSLSRIDEVSKKYRIPVNALCLSFAMLNDSIDKVIIGVDSLKQLKENLDSLKYLDRVKAVYDQLGSLNLDDEDIILPVNWDRSSKASVIIQARMGATRLPGKVLMKVLDKTILEHVIERVKRSRRIDNVIVATTTKSEDKPVAELMKKCGVEVFRGSEEDVLDRFYQAAKKHNIKHIVRITADCPLIDPRIIDTAIARYFNSGADYCSNVWDRTYPDGEDVEVFNFKSLESAWKKARLLSEREHVTPFMTNNRKDFKIVQFKQGIDLSKKRWSLDRKDDYKFIKAVLEGIYPDNPDFHIGDVVKFLESNPGVEDLNKSHIINEGYQKSLREDRIITRRRRKKE